jgi:Ser/Thr protein kinase RdoA (MazF antagonist)
MEKQTKNNFYHLEPHLILDCVEKHGFVPTGEIQQLNSYENRVFDIKLEASEDLPTNLIAKFYRPDRWSLETLLDEHQFEIELKGESLQVAAPYILKNHSTVDHMNGINYTFFEKIRGRLIQEFLPADFLKMGRWMAQLHNIGEAKWAQHRVTMGPTTDHKWDLLDKMYDPVAAEVRGKYFEAAEEIFYALDEKLNDHKFLRIHGDLHRGNILESPNGFVVVDFDDFVNGPAIQDVWMMMPDQSFTESPEFENLVKGYEELRHFPHEQMELIPLLRGYRMINYAGWILNRWSDPSFPKLFPDFGTYTYWAEETEALTKIAYQI